MTEGNDNSPLSWHPVETLEDGAASLPALAGPFAIAPATASAWIVPLRGIAILTIRPMPPAPGGLAGIATAFTLVVEHDGTPPPLHWPASVRGIDGRPPRLTAGPGPRDDVFRLLTLDNGQTWHAVEPHPLPPPPLPGLGRKAAA